MARPLEGGIAKLVAGALAKAQMTKSATLTKVTPGTRIPGALTAGTQSTTADYPCQGIEAGLTALRLSGSLITGVEAAVRIIGATLPAGVTPAPGDKIAIGGVTYTVVGDAGGQRAVTRDSAAATYLCQCRR